MGRVLMPGFFNETFRKGVEVRNKSCGSGSFCNWIAGAEWEDWYYKHTDIPYEKNEMVRERYLRKRPFLDDETMGVVTPIIGRVDTEDIGFAPKGGAAHPPETEGEAVPLSPVEEGARVPW